MTLPNQLNEVMNFKSLSKPALRGFAIGIILVIIAMTVIFKGRFPVDVRVLVPLAGVGIAGAFAGMFYYTINHLVTGTSFNRTLAQVLCISCCLIGMFLTFIYMLSLIGLWN